MKLQHAILLSLSFCLTGCWTLIGTVAPTEKTATTQIVYTTHVTTPAPKQVTTTTMAVTSFNTDLSFYLDLQAVAAAFAESRSVQEFEMLLNSNRYMINNLDLNGDGYIDYLRVLETRQGYFHAFLIQACIAPTLFQDVATLVAERRARNLYVEVIGDPYLYGYNYIVRPTFVNRPPLWDAFGRPTYVPWNSPYYYGNWPHHYQPLAPVYLTHYQAYVDTYMHNHHYCHVCDYPSHFFYNDYHHMTQPHRRNDYGRQHPDRSFEHRVVRHAASHDSNTPIRNAGELRNQTHSRSRQTTSTNSTPSTNRPTTTRPSQTTIVNTTTRPSAPATQPSTPTTSIESRVNRSGTTRTTVRTSTNVTTTERNSTSPRSNKTTQETSSSRSSSAQSSRTGNTSNATRR